MLGMLIAFAGLGSNLNSASAAPTMSVPSEAVTVPAGGTAQLQVRAFSMQPGAPIPLGALAPAAQPMASDRVRTTLFYGINWGYTDTDSQQVALAIWWAQDGNWLSPDHAAAERIGNAAAGASGLPFWNPDGRSLTTLVSQGQTTISPLSLNASGAGTLTVHNNSALAVSVYLPYGTLFTGPGGTALVWAAGGAPVPLPTNTQAAQPTSTSTVAATNTPAQVTPTDAAPIKGGDATSTPEAVAPAKADSPTASPTPQPIDPSPTSTLTATTEATSVAPQQGDPPALEPVQSAPTTAAPQPAKSGASDAVEPAVKPAEPTHPAPVPTNTQQPAKPTATAEKNSSRNEVAAPVQPKEEPKQESSDKELAPPPPAVGTTVSQVTKQASNSAPPPVGTNPPLATPPNPELTKLATVPPLKETATPTFTPVVKATVASTDPPKPGPGSTDSNPTVPPKATPLPPVSSDGGAIINVAPDPRQVPVDGTPKSPVPAPAPQPSNGGKPNTNPVTGGGPSSVPAWLGMFSALLVLGGWSLRRMSSQELQPVFAQQDELGENNTL